MLSLITMSKKTLKTIDRKFRQIRKDIWNYELSINKTIVRGYDITAKINDIQCLIRTLPSSSKKEKCYELVLFWQIRLNHIIPKENSSSEKYLLQFSDIFGNPEEYF